MRDDASRDERGSFPLEAFAEELAGARLNREIGTSLWFANDHIRVFEASSDPMTARSSSATIRSVKLATSSPPTSLRSYTTWRTSETRFSASSPSSSVVEAIRWRARAVVTAAGW